MHPRAARPGTHPPAGNSLKGGLQIPCKTPENREFLRFKLPITPLGSVYQAKSNMAELGGSPLLWGGSLIAIQIRSKPFGKF